MHRSAVQLKQLLQRALTLVNRRWSYETKDWVTGIHVLDVDSEGDQEIIVGSRDGRVRMLSERGELLWERIVGSKKPISAVMGVICKPDDDKSVAVLVGTQDGRVYALNIKGETLSKDCQETFIFDDSGQTVDHEREVEATWYEAEYEIRHFAADLSIAPLIIVDAEQRSVQAFNSRDGHSCWSFTPSTNSQVSAMFAGDINNDGCLETLVATSDQHLYLLNEEGESIADFVVPGQVHLIGSAQMDHEGKMRVLLGMDEKTLAQLLFEPSASALESCTYIEEWLYSFSNEFHMLSIADLNGDDLPEILVASEDRRLYILNSEGKELWRHYEKQHITSLYTADVDGDGEIEVLVGSEENKENSLRVLHMTPEADLMGNIQSMYQELKRPSIPGMTELSDREKTLLQTLVTDARTRSSTRSTLLNLKQIDKWRKEERFSRALAVALQLEQQHIQPRWQSEPLGVIKALCFGDIYSDLRREIMVGVASGAIHAFNFTVAQVGEFPVEGQLVGLCAAYVNDRDYVEILAGSTNNAVYVLKPKRRPKGTGKNTLETELTQTIQLPEPLTALCVDTEDMHRSVKVILATEEKQIRIYNGSNLNEPERTFPTPEVINVLAARTPNTKTGLAIVAGGVKDSIYAFAHDGTQLWEYRVYGRAEAIRIADIDGDHSVEVIVGSQGRNLNVIDATGQLKWRYYLPDYVYSVDVIENRDGEKQVLAGCKDSYLYAFSSDGDLLWKYQAREAISFLDASDIDYDQSVEIVMALGDTLAVMQIIDNQKISDIIQQCWREMQKQDAQWSVQKLLQDVSPLLRAFGLRELAEQSEISEEDFKACAAHLKDGSGEVRKALVTLALRHYHAHSDAAQLLLLQLGRDQDIEVMTALVRQITDFIERDKALNWDIGFNHLQRIANRFVQLRPKDSDRYILHGIMRALYRLSDDLHQQSQRKSAIFNLLLEGLRYEKSKWVQYEAARSLARFLDLYYSNLLVYLEMLIVYKVEIEILLRVVYHATNPSVKHVFKDLINLIGNLTEQNVHTRLEEAISALSSLRAWPFGRETWLLYKELQLLMSMRTVVDIADYECKLEENANTTNQHYLIARSIFRQLYFITRPLQRYQERVGIKDRISSLLEAGRAVDNTRQFMQQKYETPSFGQPRNKLPDYQIFLYIFELWKGIIDAELRQVSGKPEISARLETKIAHSEKHIAVSLQLSNDGQSTAHRVHVELMNSKKFRIIGSNACEYDVLFAQQTVTSEFTISPLVLTSNLQLVFDIEYYETEDGMVKRQSFDDTLILHEPEPREFHDIPNLYSGGVPMRDKEMCYGREEDLAVLSERLRQTRLQSLLILYGQRRTGKTTVLLQLNNTDILDPHIPCFVDIQMLASGVTESRFFNDIADSVIKALKKHAIRLASPDDAAFERGPTLAFNRLLDEVEANLGERKLIILIDEFDVLDGLIKSGKLAPEILGYLRSLIQHREKVSFLLAGVHTIMELTEDYWSVFFQLADHYHLSHLSEKATVDLITKPVKDYLEYEEFAIKKIRQLTADQPYLVNIVCRRLVDYCNDQRKYVVTTNDINTIRDEVMLHDQQHFEWVWKESTDEEHILLAILAEAGGADGRPLSIIEIEKQYRYYRIRYEREIVLETLKGMVKKDMLERTVGNAQEDGASEDRYRIPVGLIRVWLRATWPPARLVREQGPRV